MAASPTPSGYTNVSGTDALRMEPVTSATPQVDTTLIQVVTTAASTSTDTAVIAVVIVLILLTVAALGILLYRYLCHNKGDYRTTGELAPGEDTEEDNSHRDVSEKKEYFI